MTQETTLFLNDFFFNSGLSFLDALDAPWTYANARLAQHYGLSGVTGTAFQKVSLAGANRAGLLGQASILTTTSLPDAHVAGQARLLGARPTCCARRRRRRPTTCRRSTAHRCRRGRRCARSWTRTSSNPVCAACHKLMDPIGFGLEHFDAIGAWRDRDGTAAIDATGVLPDMTGVRRSACSSPRR